MSEIFDNIANQISSAGEKKDMLDRAQDDYLLRKTKSYLFFDDDTEVEFLASQRFPNDPQGALRYKNINGELFYVDDQGELQKEFPDNNAVNSYMETVVPNLVPAATD